MFTIHGTPSRGDTFVMRRAYPTLEDAIAGVHAEIATYAEECGGSYDREAGLVFLPGTGEDYWDVTTLDMRDDPMANRDRAVTSCYQVDTGDCTYDVYEHAF